MNSNVKLVLFFLVATLFNILLMFLIIVVLFVAMSRILGPNADDNLRAVLMIVIFIGSIVLTFWLYGRIMRWVTVRFKLETHIPQLFKGKKKQ